jgi:outer membrane protein assembly factor BamB
MRRDVQAALLAVQVPDELEAQRRTWAVVRGAYAAREPVPRRGRRFQLVVAFAVLAALVAAALSPPGRSVGGWIRDRIAGQEEAEPALFRLPAAGRLLVVSEQGPWLVRPDGSKRLLGSYEDASFSPNGKYVLVTDGRRVLALEPDSDPRWSVTRPTPVADARWGPSPGFRVAYREGNTLRVVIGDGTGDRLLAENVAPVAPAWLPEEGRTVLAYAGTDGRVHVVEVDSGEQLWSAKPGAAPDQLVWSSDGALLLVVTPGGRHPLYRAGGRPAGALQTPSGLNVLDADFAPGTRDVAYAAFDPDAGRSVVVLDGQRLQRVEGHLEDVVFSPNGRWLVTGWPEADQLLFIGLPGVRRLDAVSDVRREFDPGGRGATEFPRIVGWCCPVAQ